MTSAPTPRYPAAAVLRCAAESSQSHEASDHSRFVNPTGTIRALNQPDDPVHETSDKPENDSNV